MERKNIFVRGCIIIFIIFLGILVWLSFYSKQPQFEISSGIIIVLLLIAILILSEVFDNLSLGKLLSLSKEVKNKNDEIGVVKKENLALRDNLVTMASIFSQTQNNNTNSNVLFTPDFLRQMLGVVQANPEIKNEEPEENGNGQKDALVVDEKTEDNLKQKNQQKIIGRKEWKILENYAIDKFMKTNNYMDVEVLREVQFTSAFNEIDPIMNRQVTFDGFFRVQLREIFVEVKNSFISSFDYDRLYVLLSKILFYKQAKEVNAELWLIIVNIPEKYMEDRHRWGMSRVERLIQSFQPAIANRLLRIENVLVTEEEIVKIFHDTSNEQPSLFDNC